jgi:type I restriction enzyme M protein
MLKMGGTAAVIVPQGVLFGSGKAFKTLRKMLIEKAELKAVISMPSGVFKPYAGVATAILVFTKGGETNHVWFYGMEADGYSLDDKRTKINQSDLQDIVERYNTRITPVSVTPSEVEGEGARTAKDFFVPKDEIESNEYDLSISKYKEEVYEKIDYDKPNVIISKIESLEIQISEGISALKALL